MLYNAHTNQIFLEHQILPYKLILKQSQLLCFCSCIPYTTLQILLPTYGQLMLNVRLSSTLVIPLIITYLSLGLKPSKNHPFMPKPSPFSIQVLQKASFVYFYIKNMPRWKVRFCFIFFSISLTLLVVIHVLWYKYNFNPVLLILSLSTSVRTPFLYTHFISSPLKMPIIHNSEQPNMLRIKSILIFLVLGAFTGNRIQSTP